MYPLLVLLIWWYAILIAVLASRSSSKEIIAAGAPGFDLFVFLVEAASYRLGDDGELVSMEQPMQQITHTKDAQKRL